MAIDSTTPRTRRAILAGGIAAAAAASLGRAQPAAAHDADDVRLGGANVATSVTSITNSTNANNVLSLTSTSAGNGLEATSNSGVGVHGTSTSGSGVAGQSSNIGVHATGDYIGVYAFSDSGHAVYAQTGAGTALFGSNGSSAVAAVQGWSAGSMGLQGYSGTTGFPPPGPPKTGVYGSADQDANSVGVRGASPTGRGGRFKGRKAQIRLDPSAAATHPASGAAGDLFVDSSHRLWFCKGGATWKQLA
jgi:hypothetical protein